MGGIFPSETLIYVAAADTNGSSLASSDGIVGEITNFSLSGGEQDIESIPVIGGFVNKESPRTQFEVSFDVIVSNAFASTLDRWDIFKYGAGLTSGTEGDDKAIFVEHSTNSLFKSSGFNNARSVTWEPTISADDMLRGTMTFKFSPTTSLGAANLLTSAVAVSTAAFNW